MKNHSKKTKNVSKNDYCFPQEKRKDSVFHHYLSRKRRGMGVFMTMELKKLVKKEFLESRERMRKETMGTYMLFYMLSGIYIVSSALWGFEMESILEVPYLFIWIGYIICLIPGRFTFFVRENGRYANIFEKYRYIPVARKQLFYAKLIVSSKNICIQTVLSQAAALLVRAADLDHDGGKFSDLTVWVPVMAGAGFWLILAGKMFRCYIRSCK